MCRECDLRGVSICSLGASPSEMTRAAADDSIVASEATAPPLAASKREEPQIVRRFWEGMHPS